MALDDRRQRLDHRLDALAGRDQPERREQEPLAHAAVRAPRGRARRASASARALREHASARRAARPEPSRSGHASAVDQQPPRRLGHHDHELGLAAELRRAPPPDAASAPTAPCAASRRAAARAPRASESTYSPSRAAEDPVLVLEQDDVDVEPAEHPRRADVVAANRLRDRRDEPRPLRARRLVDDHDLLDALDARRRRAAPRARRRQRCRSRRRAAGRSRRSRCARLPASLP